MNSNYRATKVAVVGAGIYGSTIALHLRKSGFNVDLYDPLGVLMAASSINQFRVHAGYHYPRSTETISEVLMSRKAFISEYKEAIVFGKKHYYAIPKIGSRISPHEYIKIMDSFGLSLREVKPKWMDFSFIETCWEVDEELYNPEILREILTFKLKQLKVNFIQRSFQRSKDEKNYDNVIYATYGVSNNWNILPGKIRVEVAEKILVKLPNVLQQCSLVIVDGAFTAFDYCGKGNLSQFGSAKHTNHWKTNSPNESMPDRYKKILNSPQFLPVNFSHYSDMVIDASMAVPLVKKASYMGSKFTTRVVEDAPTSDKRLLYVQKEGAQNYHVFSGKVVGAVKAAELVLKDIKSCHESV